jgi:hypothetical protein
MRVVVSFSGVVAAITIHLGKHCRNDAEERHALCLVFVGCFMAGYLLLGLVGGICTVYTASLIDSVVYAFMNDGWWVR